MKIITTTAEVKDLPKDAVVRDSELVILEAQADDEESRRWLMTGYDKPMSNSSVILPAFVLWDPRVDTATPAEAVAALTEGGAEL